MTKASLDFRRGFEPYLLAAVIDIIASADCVSEPIHMTRRVPSEIDYFLQWIGI